MQKKRSVTAEDKRRKLTMYKDGPKAAKHKKSCRRMKKPDSAGLTDNTHPPRCFGWIGELTAHLYNESPNWTKREAAY